MGSCGAQMKDLMDKKMLRAIEGLSAAEAEVHRRDSEIRQLKERLKSIEEQGGRIDGQLHANISLLQAEKNGALEENRVLLEQVCKQLSRLRLHVSIWQKLCTSSSNIYSCVQNFFTALHLCIHCILH